MGQTGKNITVVIGKEGTFGVAAGAGTGKVLRINPSPGLNIQRTLIQSSEFRKDGQKVMSRLGSKSVTGSYEFDTVAGAQDDLYEGLMRGTWSAPLASTSADFTTIAITGTNLITWASGNPITKGYRVGDIFRITGSANASNNNKYYRLIAVTATTMTVPTGELANQGADGTGTLTRPKRLVNPTVPTRASYTITEDLGDIDDSEQFLGTRIVGGKFSLIADQIAKFMATFLGQTGSILGAGATPYFSAPATFAGSGLVAVDGFIRFNGADKVDLTGLEMDFQLGGKVEPVIGSLISPDVFENDLGITGQLTGLRTDMTRAALFLAETEFELWALLQTPAPNPTIKDTLSIFLPKCKLTQADAPLGADGGQIETLPFIAGIRDTVTTGYDITSAVICSSAA